MGVELWARPSARRSFGFLAAVAIQVGIPQQAAARQIRFDSLFEWTGALVLEERPEAVNSGPVLGADPLGGWIVTDTREAQVRLYDSSGRLRAYFGRGGQGPGEFRSLIAAFRTNQGQLVTVDQTGRLIVWTEDGSRHQRTLETRVPRVQAATDLGPDSTILLTVPQLASPSGLTSSVLHVTDLSRGQVARRMLEISVPESEITAWVSITAGGLTRAGEWLFVTLPLADTIWGIPAPYDAAARRIAINSSYISARRPIPNPSRDRAAFDRWVRDARFVGAAYPAGSDAVFVSLYGVGKDPILLTVPFDGSRAQEVIGAPTLFGFDSLLGEYVFRDPDELEPNRFRRARLRSAQGSSLPANAPIGKSDRLRGSEPRIR